MKSSINEIKMVSRPNYTKLVNRPNSVIRRITETEKEVKKKNKYQK